MTYLSDIICWILGIHLNRLRKSLKRLFRTKLEHLKPLLFNTVNGYK